MDVRGIDDLKRKQRIYNEVVDFMRGDAIKFSYQKKALSAWSFTYVIIKGKACLLIRLDKPGFLEVKERLEANFNVRVFKHEDGRIRACALKPRKTK
jgi:hypothetical protein